MKYYVVNDLDYVETIEKDVKDRITIEYVSNWKCIKNPPGLRTMTSYPIFTNLKLVERNTYYVIVLYCDITENTNIIEYDIPFVIGIFDDIIKTQKLVTKLKKAFREKSNIDFQEDGLEDFVPIDFFGIYSKVDVKIEKMILKGD